MTTTTNRPELPELPAPDWSGLGYSRPAMTRYAMAYADALDKFREQTESGVGAVQPPAPTDYVRVFGGVTEAAVKLGHDCPSLARLDQAIDSAMAETQRSSHATRSDEQTLGDIAREAVNEAMAVEIAALPESGIRDPALARVTGRQAGTVRASLGDRKPPGDRILAPFHAGSRRFVPMKMRAKGTGGRYDSPAAAIEKARDRAPGLGFFKPGLSTQWCAKCGQRKPLLGGKKRGGLFECVACLAEAAARRKAQP